MTSFAWGASQNGQLGIYFCEEVNKSSLPLPHEVTALAGKPVECVSCGLHHICVLLQDGTVSMCGENNHCQLGRDGSPPGLVQVSALETLVIKQACCGDDHTLVVSDRGQVLSWGRNDRGQCGMGTGDSKDRPRPRIMKSLGSHQVVTVACGSSHSLALTKEGRLFSWGDNSCGQLGCDSTSTSFSERPLEIPSLGAVPIVRLACGGWHSFVLSVSGVVYCWGRNDFGQLGLGDSRDKPKPVLLKNLCSQKVKYMACGYHHTAMLTATGGLFTFGRGTEGQLGHGSKSNEVNPRKVIELMGNSITQVTCGRHHTLVLEGKTGKLYAFGNGAKGQLGLDVDIESCSSPTLVPGPWVAHGNKEGSESSSERFIIRSIHAGGDRSFCTVSKCSNPKAPLDFRDLIPSRQPAVLTEGLIKEVPSTAHAASAAPAYKVLETVFSSAACLNASFLKGDDGRYGCYSSLQRHQVDLDAVRAAFEPLADKVEVLEMISNTVTGKLLPTLQTYANNSVLPECLHLYLLLMECPIFSHPRHAWCRQTILQMGKSILQLKGTAREMIKSWWSGSLPRHLHRILTIHRDCLVVILEGAKWSAGHIRGEDEQIRTLCLNIMHNVHVVGCDEILPYYMFYVPDIENYINVQEDYLRYFQKGFRNLMHMTREDMFTYCDYPFIFNTELKTSMLELDALLQMKIAVDTAEQMNYQNLFFNLQTVNPYLVLCVMRNNLVSSALDQLGKLASQDLKKPLQVVFIGEEAVDAGGVKKEFFMLIMREMVDPKYGMFRFYEDSGKIWFNNKSFEERRMFRLIGLVCGLAIYNQMIVSLPFPLALYKKILNRKVTLDDLSQMDPQVALGLQALLDHEDEGSFADIFPLVFQIEEENLGQVETSDLVLGGGDKEVTFRNRQEYVDAYVDYCLNSSVNEQFLAFSEGFLGVCGGKALEFFHPQELMAMVIGNEDFDWDDFEGTVTYKGEYSPIHPTIKLFWQVFREMSVADKKKFLVFLTGSDHVPIQGWRSLQVIIQPVKGGEDFYPVAHTCFNLLDLPMYTSKDVLQDKLLTAIQHTEGFTLA